MGRSTSTKPVQTKGKPSDSISDTPFHGQVTTRPRLFIPRKLESLPTSFLSDRLLL